MLTAGPPGKSQALFLKLYLQNGSYMLPRVWTQTSEAWTMHSQFDVPWEDNGLTFNHKSCLKDIQFFIFIKSILVTGNTDFKSKKSCYILENIKDSKCL